MNGEGLNGAQSFIFQFSELSDPAYVRPATRRSKGLGLHRSVHGRRAAPTSTKLLPWRRPHVAQSRVASDPGSLPSRYLPRNRLTGF